MNKILICIIGLIITNSGFAQVNAVSDPNQMLDKIENACSQLQSFQANMKYQIVQPMIDQETNRNGKLYYKVKNGGVLARINFKDLTEIDLLDDEAKPKPIIFDEDFFFDGLWVVRTNAQTKTVQRWEVSRNKEDRDSFRIGNGPFPLPFAIKKADILKYFDILLADDKNRSTFARLKLAPKPDSEYAKDYRSIEIWFNYRTFLPAKIQYVKQDYEQNTISWSNIETTKNIDDSVFDAPKTPSDWTEEVTPLKD